MISTTTITGKTGGGYKCESGTCPHGVGPDSLWRMRGELISSPSFSYDFYVEIFNQKISGYARIVCEKPALSICKPRTLTCSDEGFSCN